MTLSPRTPRVRIAPSPTGEPHIGTAHIALFNYVFAKRYGGELILRIEDIDRKRSSAASEAAILEGLRWLGFTWQEGPDVGGPHEPYRQSERFPLYRAYACLLLVTGHAYRCLCSRERLQAVREAQVAEKSDHLCYDGHCRNMPAHEASYLATLGTPHVIRLRVPEGGETGFFDDLRQDTFSLCNAAIDDQILINADGSPSYHLANVVDDHLMGITHVIRGEDWITSTPKQILLYKAFGWDPPRFIHLDLLRDADRSKMSRRRGPVSIAHYRDLGYDAHTLLQHIGAANAVESQLQRLHHALASSPGQ
jgi:glutamyl-tRNA synthetase